MFFVKNENKHKEAGDGPFLKKETQEVSILLNKIKLRKMLIKPYHLIKFANV